MASKRWTGPRARALLATLREREARRKKWTDTGVNDILADVNAALEAAWAAQEPCPQFILMSRAAYMILNGYMLVKIGRRKTKWVRT